MTPLSLQLSGYLGSADAMRRFLECWSAELDAHGSRAKGTSRTQPQPPVLLDSRLPPSALQFHRESARIGFRSMYERSISPERFADPSSLQLFREAYPEDFRNWELAFGSIEESDERYYRYDKDQPPMRGRYLANLLILGHEVGGAFYLLVEDEKTADGENEVMFLHHGGLIVRFKSFAHLLAHLYLEEHEKMAGRDPSMGHLYFYAGDMSQTCIRHLITLKS